MSEWPMGHWRNQGISGFKWKWEHNLPEPVGHSKGIFKREVLAMNANIRKLERSQIKFNDVPQILRETRTSQS
jgi:hypothetical protein